MPALKLRTEVIQGPDANDRGKIFAFLEIRAGLASLRGRLGRRRGAGAFVRQPAGGRDRATLRAAARRSAAGEHAQHHGLSGHARRRRLWFHRRRRPLLGPRCGRDDGRDRSHHAAGRDRRMGRSHPRRRHAGLSRGGAAAQGSGRALCPRISLRASADRRAALVSRMRLGRTRPRTWANLLGRLRARHHRPEARRGAPHRQRTAGRDGATRTAGRDRRHDRRPGLLRAGRRIAVLQPDRPQLSAHSARCGHRTDDVRRRAAPGAGSRPGGDRPMRRRRNGPCCATSSIATAWAMSRCAC